MLELDFQNPAFDWQTFLALGNPAFKKRKNMAYNKFSLEEVTSKFNLKIRYVKDIVGEHTAYQPSELLVGTLRRSLPRAIRMNTEKARSEFVVAPILLEIQEILPNKISLFSGIKFNVDKKKGLSGRCDFLISFSEEKGFLTFPVISIVEAKNENVSDENALGQCVAEMVASQIFNEQKGLEIKTIFGTVTNGTNWKFLKLEAKNLYIEELERFFDFEKNLDELLGIFLKILEPQN